MSNLFKRHFISALTTFISAFSVTLAFLIQSDTFTFTQEAIGSALMAAVYAGVRGIAKLIIEWSSGKLSS